MYYEGSNTAVENVTIDWETNATQITEGDNIFVSDKKWPWNCSLILHLHWNKNITIKTCAIELYCTIYEGDINTFMYRICCRKTKIVNLFMCILNQIYRLTEL